MDNFFELMIIERVNIKKHALEQLYKKKIRLSDIAPGNEKAISSILNNRPTNKMNYFINKSTANAFVTNLLFLNEEELLFGAEWERELYLCDLFCLCLNEISSNEDGKRIVNKALNHHPFLMKNRAEIKIANEVKTRTRLNLVIDEKIVSSVMSNYREQATLWLFDICYYSFKDYFNNQILDIKDYKNFDKNLLIENLTIILKEIDSNKEVAFLKVTFEAIISKFIDFSIEIKNIEENDLSNYQMTLDQLTKLIKDECEFYQLDPIKVKQFITQKELIEIYVETSKIYYMEDNIGWRKDIYQEFCTELMHRLQSNQIDTFSKMDYYRQQAPNYDKPLKEYKKLLKEFNPSITFEDMLEPVNSNIEKYNIKLSNSNQDG